MLFHDPIGIVCPSVSNGIIYDLMHLRCTISIILRSDGSRLPCAISPSMILSRIWVYMASLAFAPSTGSSIINVSFLICFSALLSSGLTPRDFVTPHLISHVGGVLHQRISLLLQSLLDLFHAVTVHDDGRPSGITIVGHIHVINIDIHIPDCL